MIPKLRETYRGPMSLLMEAMVLSALVTAWRLAGSPTRRSLFLVKATMEGVVLEFIISDSTIY